MKGKYARRGHNGTQSSSCRKMTPNKAQIPRQLDRTPLKCRLKAAKAKELKDEETVCSPSQGGIVAFQRQPVKSSPLWGWLLGAQRRMRRLGNLRMKDQ